MERNRQFDERYLVFGAAILKLLPELPHNKVGAHLSDQLFRSGTSVGAHFEESRGAEKKADFIHKLGMALKEAPETYYWLRLIEMGEVLPLIQISELLQESNEIVAMLTASVITAKENHVKV
jgi:four helix bundle protein